MFLRVADFLRSGAFGAAPGSKGLNCLELCAGAGGQALGIEAAGFSHVGLVELDSRACATLEGNAKRHRLNWNVISADLRGFDSRRYFSRVDVDLISAGLPCPPFSRAGRQMGENDDRNLWPAALRIVGDLQPKAVMLENVPGILDPIFKSFRAKVVGVFNRAGYTVDWRVLNAKDFGVPQLRPRAFLVALQASVSPKWSWPCPQGQSAQSVGDALTDLMSKNGWRLEPIWRKTACEISPTIVGGSTKHGGPDLGPSRARRKWLTLGVNGTSLADEAPQRDFIGLPRLTLEMVARLQGFPGDWIFSGGKTARYRQIGNAIPPAVARAVAHRIRLALRDDSES